MTPQEFNFLLGMIEVTAKHAYELGHADGKAGKSLKNNGFLPNKKSQLVIRNLLKKHLENR